MIIPVLVLVFVIILRVVLECLVLCPCESSLVLALERLVCLPSLFLDALFLPLQVKAVSVIRSHCQVFLVLHSISTNHSDGHFCIRLHVTADKT